MLNSVKNHFRFLVLPQMKKTCFGDFWQMKKYLWLYPVRAEQNLSRGGGWEIFFIQGRIGTNFIQILLLFSMKNPKKAKDRSSDLTRFRPHCRTLQPCT